MNRRLENLKSIAKEFLVFFKSALLPEIGLVVAGVIMYLFLITVLSHEYQSRLMTGFVIFFSLLKVGFFLLTTLYKIEHHLLHNTLSFYRCLASFGSIVILLILSFSIDYICLSDCNLEAFSGLDHTTSIIIKFFEFNYFSVVTFATIGFGDIVPRSVGAKFIVMLEITTSFFMVVFILSNFFNLHLQYSNSRNANNK